MKKLSKETYQQIRSWVYRYARHLEIAKWQYFFEKGSKEAVIQALSFYQNEDGGFGHALEFDCWNPNSLPEATWMAYEVLKSIGCDDREHPMMKGILKYIENTEHFTEHGWYWSIPSNHQYPCAPYYQFPNAPWFPADWPPENYVNGSFIHIILKYFDKDHEIYKKTLRVIDHRLPLMHKYADFCTFTCEIEQSIESRDWVILIESLDEYGIKSSEDCAHRLSEFLNIVKSSANESVYIKIKKQIENKGVADQEDLDNMITKLSNGVWRENGLNCDKSVEKLEITAHVGYLWWPIIDAINDLKTLKEHGRLSEIL